jgi:pantoate--beta-alanine ligase
MEIIPWPQHQRTDTALREPFCRATLRRMHISHDLAHLGPVCSELRDRFGALALVPTMGALHNGHEALVRAAALPGAAVVASIFVNPLQFGPNDDLARYPRDEAGDLAKLEAWGCHAVWLPDVATMYPPGESTTVVVGGPAENWEGSARPGHFRGVATVCAKLFGQVRPDAAYFGEKDWQQLQVVQRMVADLLLPTKVVGIPTVREPDGLALSSRNRFLEPAHRAIAPRLFAILQSVALVLAGGCSAADVLAVAMRDLAADGFATDYLALVDGASLGQLQTVQPGARLIAAARLGSVRLLDNIAVTPSKAHPNGRQNQST